MPYNGTLVFKKLLVGGGTSCMASPAADLKHAKHMLPTPILYPCLLVLDNAKTPLTITTCKEHTYVYCTYLTF